MAQIRLKQIEEFLLTNPVVGDYLGFDANGNIINYSAPLLL